VTGKVKSQLFLLCSLCADAFQFPLNLQFHALLTQTEMYADVPRESSRKNAFDYDGGMDAWLSDEEDEEDEDETPPLNLSASDFEVTVVKEPLADLRELLNEQIILTLPMQPKPDTDDKGDCVKCGRNQDSFSIEAEEPLKENPFAVLKNLKKKTDA
jgi:hypothetical protein